MIKAILLFLSLLFIQQVPEKTAKAEMTKSEWITIINIIDNAAVPGEVRKPLINKLSVQLAPQLNDSIPKK